MANSVDPDQTAPIGAVCSGSTLFASILNSSVMLENYLQQTTSADDIFRCIFFLGALRVKKTKSATMNIFRKFSFLFKSFVKVELSYVFTINLCTISENCMEK